MIMCLVWSCEEKGKSQVWEHTLAVPKLVCVGGCAKAEGSQVESQSGLYSKTQ